MDATPIILMVVPAVTPLLNSTGLDPIHVGVLFCILCVIGLITPPMGQLVFLISGITGIKVAVILGEVWGLLFMLIVALFVLVFVPQITLWLPIAAGYIPQGTFH